MKKLLALVLALVMTMSLVTISNAAYTDAADVSLNEAVDVMSAVGVFEGADNKFSPKDNLTREQAAKLIAYLDLGKTVADALPNVQVFTDVAADRWSAKYIAYCADAGYIAGVGDGKFNPTGELTGYAFGKMILCTLGYDAKLEGYVGSANWAIAVAKAMSENNIAKGVSAAPSATLTREQAAQYCLNALKATTVEYETKGTTISVSGTTIVNGAAKAKPVTIVPDGAKYDAIDNTHDASKCIVQLGEKLYKGDLRLLPGTSDDFGRPSHDWVYKNKTVNTTEDTAVAVFTAKTKADDVVSVLGAYSANVYTTSVDTKTLKINNVTNVYNASHDTYVVAKVTEDGTSVAQEQVTEAKTLAAFIADKTANGKVVEVYANSNNIVTNIVEINYTVAKVQNITTAKSGTTYTLNKLYAGGATASGTVSGTVYTDDANTSDTAVLKGTFAKGDIVTCATVAGKTYIYPTTEVTGTQTSWSQTTSGVRTITVSGTKYTVAAAALNTAFDNGSADAKYYVDQFGYVVKTTAISSSTYAYVLDAKASVSKTASGSVSASAEVKVLLSDGTVGTYDLATYKVKASDVANGGQYYEVTRDTEGPSAYIVANDVVIKNTSILIGNGGVDTTEKANTNLNNYLVDCDTAFTYSIKDKTITLDPVDTFNGSAAPAQSSTYAYKFDNDTSSIYVKQNDTKYAINATYSILADAKTTFVVYNSDKGTAALYVGASALPRSINDMNASGTFVFSTPASAANYGTASLVFVTVGSALAADTTTAFAFVDVSTQVTTGANDDKTYSYDAYLADGSKITVTSSEVISADGVYTYTNKNEVSNSSKQTTDRFSTAASEQNLTSNDTSLVQINGSWYNVTEDTVVVYVNGDVEKKVDGNKGYAVRALVNGNASTNLEVIYITDKQ